MPNGIWGSTCQSMFVCQVLCTGIQGISALFGGHPLAKVGSSAKLGVVVFRHLCLIHQGGSICQSMFVFQVLCTGIQGIYVPFMGGTSAKVCLSAKCCVVVFKASMLYLWGAICQSVFSCQVLCTGIQGIYALLGGSIGQSRFICQVWCSGIQGIDSQFTGRSISQSRFICQALCTGIQGNYSC